MSSHAPRQERFAMDGATASQLGSAERRLGQVAMLGRLWPHWQSFSRGALVACSALGELRLRGEGLDLAELLALGLNPEPARPHRALRRAVGYTLCRRILEDLPLEEPLTPSIASRIHHGIDAPLFSRGYFDPDQTPSDFLEGAAVWTLAPRWISTGLPVLWACGLALASWEREGPDDLRRSLTGRVLSTGLAPRMGIPSNGFAFLGPGMMRAAAHEPGGLAGLTQRVRSKGEWRRFVVLFLKAVELSAAQVVKISLLAQELHQSHIDLIETWVRAPRHPKRLLNLLVGRPVIDLPTVSEHLEVTQRTAGLLAKKLTDQGLLVEVTGQKRGRRFAYAPLLEMLQPGWGKKPESS